MTHEDFNKIQLEIFDDILKMAKTKGVEYSSDKNERLANFKRLAAELEIPATKVGYIYFKKHLDAITTYLKDGRVYSEEGIRGRFVDAINYLTLIYGLIVDSDFEKTGEKQNEIKGPESKFTLHEYDEIPEQAVWQSSEHGPICKICRKLIQKGDKYIIDKVKGYSHLFHHETSAKNETKAENK